jgi:hypothetical protein
VKLLLQPCVRAHIVFLAVGVLFWLQLDHSSQHQQMLSVRKRVNNNNVVASTTFINLIIIVIVASTSK